MWLASLSFENAGWLICLQLLAPLSRNSFPKVSNGLTITGSVRLNAAAGIDIVLTGVKSITCHAAAGMKRLINATTCY